MTSLDERNGLVRPRSLPNILYVEIDANATKSWRANTPGLRFASGQFSAVSLRGGQGSHSTMCVAEVLSSMVVAQINFKLLVT
jgi:hypothetical protein